MAIADILIGKPLATSDERAEHIGVAAGIPIFGLDGLTSAAYGPEAAITLLIPLGLMGLHYAVPIISAILILLGIVYVSYRQTIAAYPNGGGSYTVATENLGNRAGLLAAAALMIDYILTAAVGISASVEALTSVDSKLLPYTLPMCLLILAVLALVNMRGVKDTGKAFIVPTFFFVGTLLTLIGVGVFKVFAAGGHPVPVATLPAPPPQVMGALTLWLLMKAFASGCAAMTGVEAVSNGVMAFGEPRAKKAQRTLTVIIGILMVLLFGITWLAKKYGIMPMDPNATNFQSLLSLLVSAVFGRTWFYYLTMGSVLLALALSANTAFADFPRLVRAIAQHDYLPHVFILRGRRLLFSHGIYALTGFTGLILILFRGVTDRLIPLYAIGAFLAFTLSQAGMVVHWRHSEAHAGRTWHMFVNGFGAVATGLTLIVVVIAKFMAGAWVTVLLGAGADLDDGGGEAALQPGERGDVRPDGDQPEEPGRADCGDSDGAVGQDYGEGASVWAAAEQGDQGGACALGRGRGGCGTGVDLGGVYPEADRGKGAADAGAGDDSVELPVCDFADYGLRQSAGGRASWAEGGGGSAGNGGEALVGECTARAAGWRC